jgi:hypothetical protein
MLKIELNAMVIKNAKPGKYRDGGGLAALKAAQPDPKGG